jgi:diguanylate cyclase (GGDEF)-like protein/PAS domain S-box-containing protein
VVPARTLLAAYGLWVVGLAVVGVLRPTWYQYAWSLVGLSAAVAVIVGTVVHRPRRSLPWLLVGLGLAAFVTGDTVYNVLVGAFHQENPFPGLPDVFYVLADIALVAGLTMLARSGTTVTGRGALVDAIAVTIGLGTLLWIYVVEPDVDDPGLSVLARVLTIAYPLISVLILSVIVRLVAVAKLSPSVFALITGSLGLLGSDVLYGMAQFGGEWQIGSPRDIGWFVFYVAFGVAALHPCMVQLTEPRVARPHKVSALRLALLVGVGLIPPGVLWWESMRGRLRDGPFIALAASAIVVLLILRLSGQVGVHRQALARERALREAGARLVAANDISDVTAAVRAAVAELLPPGTEHRVVMTVRDASGEERMEYGARPPYSVVRAHEIWPAGPFTERAAKLLYRRGIEPSVAMHLGYHEVALKCPIVLDDRQAGDPRVGMLFVSADDTALAQLISAVQVLASQAALALERISLASEVTKRNSEVYFRTLVQNMADVILIINDDGRVRYASPSADAMFGGTLTVGTALDDVIHPDDRLTVDRALQLMRLGVDRGHGEDWTVLHADGGRVQVEASGRDLRHDPTVRGLVVTLRDVTERRLLERELMHRAFHDSLTGLPNRVLFADRVQQAFARSQRSGAVVGVLFIDLDDFKVVNDTMGHEVGDRLLRAVGQRLAGHLRQHDSAARLGGDEFAALIDDVSDAAEIEIVADRITTALAEPFPFGKEAITCAASVGVATTVEAGSADDLLRQADLALYVAKGAGKKQFRRYQSAIHNAVLRRLELRAALDQAVADGAFTLRYQPIVDLATGSPAGFEALVRWNHPVRGLVEPRDFIELAEETGLIVPIGGWVLEHAMAQAAQWQATLDSYAPGHNGVPYVSVNVSVRQFRAPGFADRLLQNLTASGLPAHALMLEITESLLLRDDEQVWADLAALRETGVRVAIDDFGTGYSSLSYLSQTPIDVVKIDRSFIVTMSTSPQQKALVDGIVRLAHTLGLQVVAEGVEDQQDRETLREMGCPLGQGYLFAAPLSYAEAVDWLLGQVAEGRVVRGQVAEDRVVLGQVVADQVAGRVPVDRVVADQVADRVAVDQMTVDQVPAEVPSNR